MKNWTTEQPTQPGFYGVRRADKPFTAWLVYLAFGDGLGWHIYQIGAEEPTRIIDCGWEREWLGPIALARTTEEQEDLSWLGDTVFTPEKIKE